jgi:hypothetical protein
VAKTGCSYKWNFRVQASSLHVCGCGFVWQGWQGRRFRHALLAKMEISLCRNPKCICTVCTCGEICPCGGANPDGMPCDPCTMVILERQADEVSLRSNSATRSSGGGGGGRGASANRGDAASGGGCGNPNCTQQNCGCGDGCKCGGSGEADGDASTDARCGLGLTRKRAEGLPKEPPYAYPRCVAATTSPQHCVLRLLFSHHSIAGWLV